MPELMPLFRRALLCLTLGAAALPPAAATAEPYLLHPQDRVLIRVLVWDFGQSDPGGATAISGEYVVSAEGQLQIPMAGLISAKDRSLTDLRATLGDLIRRSAGLDRAPEISVELVSSLPVYVLGAAQTPGAVTYHPGLSAQQALALAGGLYRAPAANDALRAEQLGAEARQWRETLTRLRAEQDILEAALSGQEGGAPAPTAPDASTVPLQAAPDATLARLHATEATTRAARHDSLRGLGQLLQGKADNLRQQITLRERQLADLRNELAAVSQLHDKGLTNNARLTALSSSVSDMEARKLELETALMLTEQELNQSGRDLAALDEDARSAWLNRLAGLEAEIASATIRLDSTTRQLAALPAPGVSGATARPTPHYQLTRDSGAGPETRPAGPAEPLLPGDVLDITLTPLEAQ